MVGQGGWGEIRESEKHNNNTGVGGKDTERGERKKRGKKRRTKKARNYSGHDDWGGTI